MPLISSTQAATFSKVPIRNQAADHMWWPWSKVFIPRPAAYSRRRQAQVASETGQPPEPPDIILMRTVMGSPIAPSSRSLLARRRGG